GRSSVTSSWGPPSPTPTPLPTRPCCGPAGPRSRSTPIPSCGRWPRRRGGPSCACAEPPAGRPSGRLVLPDAERLPDRPRQRGDEPQLACELAHLAEGRTHLGPVGRVAAVGLADHGLRDRVGLHDL